MAYAIIDFEARSAADLKKCGAWVYSQHPTTEPLCLGYALNGGPSQLWTPKDSPPQDLFDAIAAGCWLIAHNALFERAMWTNVMVPQFGWPTVPDGQWYDTMASCARRALPLKLEKVGPLLHLANTKDDEGHQAMLKLAKPVKRTGGFREDEELLGRVYEYCRQDVQAEDALLRRLRFIEKPELDIWRLNQRMNLRGLQIDLEFNQDCQVVVDRTLGPLNEEFRALVGCNAGQRDKFLAWLEPRKPFPNLQAVTVSTALADWPLPDEVRRALVLRNAITSTSIKKLAAMRACAGADGRARGLIQYHGATTGRDSGRLLQPQNFPRGKVEFGKDENGEEIPPWDVLVPAIQTCDPDVVRVLLGGVCPIDAVSAALRHNIVAAPGKLLVAGDFSTIEARIVLALGGQQDILRKMADPKYDIYCDMASQVLKRPIDKEADKHERQNVGKPTVLGCGFGMGKDKFHARYMPKEPLALAEQCVATYREQWAPGVPNLWRGLEQAACKTVWDRVAHSHGPFEFRLEEDWLTCRMPSGRKLYYFKPRTARRAMPWDADDIRPAWTYLASKQGSMATVDAYGGHLTENVTQALARDLLYDRAQVAEREGFPLVLTVHDEIVCEVDEARADPKVLQQIMEERPQWAKNLGLPVGAGCWAGERYRK